MAALTKRRAVTKAAEKVTAKWRIEGVETNI